MLKLSPPQQALASLALTTASKMRNHRTRSETFLPILPSPTLAPNGAANPGAQTVYDRPRSKAEISRLHSFRAACSCPLVGATISSPPAAHSLLLASRSGALPCHCRYMRLLCMSLCSDCKLLPKRACTALGLCSTLHVWSVAASQERASHLEDTM